jgi:hypothetical protein
MAIEVPLIHAAVTKRNRATLHQLTETVNIATLELGLQRQRIDSHADVGAHRSSMNSGTAILD